MKYLLTVLISSLALLLSGCGEKALFGNNSSEEGSSCESCSSCGSSDEKEVSDKKSESTEPVQKGEPTGENTQNEDSEVIE